MLPPLLNSSLPSAPSNSTSSAPSGTGTGALLSASTRKAGSGPFGACAAGGNFVPACEASRTISCMSFIMESSESALAAGLRFCHRLRKLQHQADDGQVVLVTDLQHGRAFRRGKIERDRLRSDDGTLGLFLPMARRELAAIERQHRVDFGNHMGMHFVRGCTAGAARGFDELRPGQAENIRIGFERLRLRKRRDLDLGVDLAAVARS